MRYSLLEDSPKCLCNIALKIINRLQGVAAPPTHGNVTNLHPLPRKFHSAWRPRVGRGQLELLILTLLTSRTSKAIKRCQVGGWGVGGLDFTEQRVPIVEFVL